MRWILTFLMSVFFIVVAGAAQADTYRLRPGDVLEVIVFQDPKLNRQIVVAPDGYVAFPLAGRFKAGGLTTSGVEAALKKGLQKQYTTDLDVTVSYIQSEKREPRQLREAKVAEYTVYVTGEVAKPGAFVVPRRPPTVLQAIALSGGLGPFAAPRRIHVVRNINGEDVAFPFNYKPYEKGDNLGGNIRLRNGDVVVVPERGLFE